LLPIPANLFRRRSSANNNAKGHPGGTKTGNVIHIFQSGVETIIAHDRPVLGAGSIGRRAALPLLWMHRARPARLGSKGAKPSGSRNDRWVTSCS